MTRVLLAGVFDQGSAADNAICESLQRSLARCSVTSESAAAVDGRGPRLRKPRRALLTSQPPDVVVIGGGPVFTRLPASTGQRPDALLRSTAALVAAARARGVSVALIGVGAGDLAGREARALARWIVVHSDLLVLSDDESAAILGASGAPLPLRVGADPAWLVVGDSGARRPERRADCSVTIAIDHLSIDHSLVGRLATALTSLPIKCRIRLEPTRPGVADDAILAAEMAAAIGRHADVVAAPGSLRAAGNAYRQDRLVVATHFHALVAAAAAGTRVLALGDDPRLAGLARRLDQTSVPTHAAEGVVRHALADSLDKPAATASAVATERTRATQAMGLLQLLVDRGVTEDPASIASPPLSTGTAWW